MPELRQVAAYDRRSGGRVWRQGEAGRTRFSARPHVYAAKAAEAAEAARDQGKYWEYVAMLFKNQDALEVAKLKEYATQLGLDRAKFDQALDSGKFADKVRDMSEGNKLESIPRRPFSSTASASEIRPAKP